MLIWVLYMGILLYWEIIYHFAMFGFTISVPWIMLGLLAVMASLQTLITGFVEKKHKKKCFWLFLIPEYLLFGVQTVYFTIFRQPLQIRAMFMGAQDALTNYWREMFMGIFKALPVLILLGLPLIGMAYVFYRKKWVPVGLESIQKVRTAFALGVSVLFYWMVLELGQILEADYYQEYAEFYDPTIVMQDAGVLTMVQRDVGFELEILADEIFPSLMADRGQTPDGPLESDDEASAGEEETGKSEDTLGSEMTGTDDVPAEETPGDDLEGDSGDGVTLEGDPEGEDSSEENPGEEQPEKERPEFHAIDLDLVKLAELSAGNKEKQWLADYIAGLEPVRTNEYTGMFEGYNLIYLTAEGFSTYAVNAELTPTLYKLVNSGFVFTNYYVPLWQTSTSDGEYVNLTGLIPDGQFSMKKTSDNNMAYSLPRFFGSDGCVNMAYHNNTLSYYDRHLSHPNLGYEFKASKLGELSEEEWGDRIFYMENPGRWPSSDLEMIQYTLPEYIQAERFNVYYMTVSGHMYYSFTGNSMSSKNKEAVAGLDMSENARAYIACHIELDKALEHLLAELEKAGKLENTVIALSADHYPYAMTEEQYEELAGKDLSNNRDLFRNSLILWNGGMEESVMVTKPCCSVDILPTLLNLFGFEYDSRMFAGRDILSDAEGLVIFNDRSFVTDKVVYDRKAKTTTWRVEMSAEEQEAYMSAMKQEVKKRYEFSAYMLRQDYYDILKQCESN